MDVSKILFNFLKTDNISSSFEDLDVNGDGKINNQDTDETTNSAISSQIRYILEAIDPEPEIKANNTKNTDFSQFSLNNLLDELEELEKELEKKQENYENLEDKIEEKQEEYETLLEMINNAEDNNISSLKNQAKDLESEIRLFGVSLMGLASEINTLENEYNSTAKALDIRQKAIQASAKTGNTNSQKTSNTSKSDLSDTEIANTITSNDATETAQSTTPTATTKDSDNALYVEGKGVNIYNFGKMISDILDKIRWDRDVNAQYQNSILGKRDTIDKKFEFTVNYILENGTDEQKNAIQTLFSQNKNSETIARKLKRFFKGKRTKDTGKKFRTETTYNLANFITKMCVNDASGDGFISQNEYNGKGVTPTGRMKGFLTTDGTIEEGHFVEDPNNLYAGGEYITPTNSIKDVKTFSKAIINGKTVYNVVLRDTNMTTSHTGTLMGCNELHLSQNEVEKLCSYFNTQGDNATLEGALFAMGITNIDKKKYTASGNMPCTTFEDQSDLTRYNFTGESGLKSTLAIGSKTIERKTGTRTWNDKVLKNLKLLAQAISNMNS